MTRRRRRSPTAFVVAALASCGRTAGSSLASGIPEKSPARSFGGHWLPNGFVSPVDKWYNATHRRGSRATRNDRSYLLRRESEERIAATHARGKARAAHEELAKLYHDRASRAEREDVAPESTGASMPTELGS